MIESLIYKYTLNNILQACFLFILLRIVGFLSFCIVQLYLLDSNIQLYANARERITKIFHKNMCCLHMWCNKPGKTYFQPSDHFPKNIQVDYVFANIFDYMHVKTYQVLPTNIMKWIGNNGFVKTTYLI